MKTIYALLITLGLLFFDNPAGFAGGISCSGNIPPIIQLSVRCDSMIEAKVGIPVIISGSVVDPNVGDNISLSATGIPVGAIVTPTLPTFGNPIPIAFSWTPTAAYDGITVTVVFAANDLCFTISTCSFTIHVTCAPITVNCPADTTVFPNRSNCSAAINYVASAFCPSGLASFTSTPASGSTFPAGKTTVVATATDVCGNTATCSFAATVEDLVPPLISCPGNMTSPATSGSPCGATVSYILSAFDAGGLHSLTVSPQGAFFPVGKTTVVATASDVCGNTSTCSFDVTVSPPPPPTITCPGNTQVSGVCAGVVTFTPPFASGVGPIVVSTVPPSGSVFQAGTTTVTATATDACGGTATCSFTITIIEPPTPVIHCPGNISLPANAGSCSAVVFYPLNVEGGNPDDDITSDHPSGSTFPQGTTTVHASVTDRCGNSTSCSFTVTVTSSLTVNAGPDVSTVFGYPSTQTATNTAVASGGSGSYSYSWSLNRALLCNQVNTSGDELFTGGSCTNNICPGTGSVIASAPACSGSATINATLLADAVACVTVTDANGCRASDCFNIAADDGRCFSGATGKKKTKVCHHTNSPTNPWVQICIDKTAIGAHLAHNHLDYVGPCASGATRSSLLEEDETFVLYPNPVGSELTLDFGSDGIRSVQLYNTLGALLYETKSEWEQLKLDMSGYPTGIYIISVRDEDNTIAVKKFVKM